MEETSPLSRFAFILKMLGTLAGVYYSVLFFLLSVPRLLYPYEIDWMEGSIIRSAVRIFQGKQLFAAPSIEMVNWQYQPLFYYCTAGAMYFFGVNFFSGRFISLLSTVVSSILILFVVHKQTRSWLYGFLGASLFLAAYGLTGYWYDLAHVDSLLIVLLLASVMLTVRNTNRSVFFAAFFMALAFFTKQEAAFYAIPSILWIFLKDKKKASVYGISILLFVAAGIIFLHHENGRWYWYYVFHIPLAMGAWQNWSNIWGGIAIPLFSSFAVGSILVVMFWIMNWQERKRWITEPITFFTFLFLTAIIQTAIHLGHPGTYKNVLIPLVVCIALLVPCIARYLTERYDQLVKYFAFVAILFQFGGLFYSFRNVPLVRITKKDYEAADSFIKELRAMPGNILMQDHEFIPDQAGKRSYAHLLAAEECRDAGDSSAKRFWKDWQNSLATHLYDAIIVDESLYTGHDSIPGYMLAGLVNVGENPFVTRISDGKCIPRYVFLPKK